MNTSDDATDVVRMMFGQVAYRAHMQGLQRFVRVQPTSDILWQHLDTQTRELYCDEAMAVINAFVDNLHPEARAHLLSIYAGIIARTHNA